MKKLNRAMISLNENQRFSKFSIFNFQFSICLISLLLSSCSPSDVPSGSISGNVSLEGNPNSEAIYIGLYNLATLDPIIVEANNTWPHIGVIINQKTDFDHRLHEPLYHTLSDATGSYELEDVPIGEYNIVFYKEGWGFKYLLNYEVEKGDIFLGDVLLYEETVLDGDYSNNLVMQEDHHYILEDNVNIVPGAKLTIESGAVIRINPGKSLNIWGEIQAQGEADNMFWITSNDGFEVFGIKHEPDDIERYNQLLLEEGITITGDVIEHGRFDFGTFALSSTGNYFRNSDCVYKYSNCGLQAMAADSCFASNCNFSNISGSNGGLFFEFILHGKVEKLISVNNEIGIRLKDRFAGIAENNYLAYNTYGFEGVHYSGTIQHNELCNNSTCDLHIAGTIGHANEPMLIFYNIFSSITGIQGYRAEATYSQTCFIERINYNNFINTIFINCNSSYQYVNTMFNYFNGLTSENDILDKISDYDNEVETYDVGEFEKNEIEDAGIIL